MASKFLTPLDLSNFTNTPLANTSAGFVKVYVKNSHLTYLLPSGLENDVVLSRPLDGLTIPTLATGIASSDSLLIALSKLQASLNNIVLTGDVTGTASYISGLLTINATLTTSGLTPTNIANWNTAYSWGDHAAAGYVPYIGATTNVNLGNHGLISDYLQLNNLPLSVPTTAGTMAWNDVDGTLDVRLKGGNVTLQVGQETIIRVVNKTDINLLEANYQVVRVRTQAEGGAQGQRLAVKLAQADSKASHTGVLGLVTETINNNEEGFITTFGLVRNINTTGNLQGETWSDGTVLWLSDTVPGGLTNIEPLTHPVQMGYVVYAHQNNGKIFVSIEEGVDELGELHNVSAVNPSNGDILQYVSSTGLWTNVAGVTTNIAEGTNLYFTDARSRAAISLTTSGTSGSATYDNITGVLNIPSYASGLTIGSTAIASGTVGRILYEGAGNVLQQSANLIWDETNNLLKIPNAKLEGGEFYSSHQPKLNLSANSGFSAIQYEFNTAAFLVGYVNVYGISGAQDVFFQGNPNSTNSYVALEAINSAGLILATANNTNPIQFRINRGLRATLNNVGFGYGVVPTAPLHAKGNSDSVGNVFIAENLSNTANLVMSNIGILTHTFTNTDYSAVATGRAVIFKIGTRELSFGSVATFTSNYNTVSNVSIIQSTNNNTLAPLKINPYGGDVHIGSLNNRVVIGNPTNAANSSQSVMIAAGNTSYTIPNLTIAPYANGGGLKFYGYGNDGQYFNSIITGESDNILFRHQLIQIGNASPIASLTLSSTQARLEINVAHRTMTDSSANIQDNRYYQRFSWIKSGAAADKYSYMMIGSHIASGMGMQMKVSPDAVAYTNGTITLNPYGGNVGVGIATAPTASLHVKGNSDSVGNIFVAENLSNTASLTIANNGVSTFTFGSGGKVFINAPVGAGDTLLEIRRSVSSSGGFIFRSNNDASQSLETTNGAFGISTVDNSNIVLVPGTAAVLLNTTVNNYNSLASTGIQFRVGTQANSSSNRWLNFGHHTNYGQVLQAVQNGSTPAIDRLSLNPYGGITNLYGELANSAVDVRVGGGNPAQTNGFRIYRGSSTNGIGFRVGNAVGFGMLITHEDATNTSGYANIQIIQGNNSVFSAGKTNSGTRNNFYGNEYGSIDSYAMMVGVKYDYSANTTRGITFNATNTSTNANVIQSVHDGVGKPLSLNTYGGYVSIGNILSPSALLDLEASTTARASLRIRSGVAPTTPNDGDIWNDGVDLKVRLAGTTYTLVKV